MVTINAAIIRNDGFVENVVVYDPNGSYVVLDGFTIMEVGSAIVSPGDWHLNGMFVPRLFNLAADPNPAAAGQAITVRATLPPGTPDTEVTFQVEGGQAYVKPVTGGQASHTYAFASPGIYQIMVSSAHHGPRKMEVSVQ